MFPGLRLDDQRTHRRVLMWLVSCSDATGRTFSGAARFSSEVWKKQAVVNAILEVWSSVIYSSQMVGVRQTPIFRKWLDDLADRRAAERIAQRIVRLQSGLIGDAKPVGGGVSELRVDWGPGYRVYFVQRGTVLIILLCGGDKRSQSRDIVRARTLAEELEDD
jgi:putative addiction module killer protein